MVPKQKIYPSLLQHCNICYSKKTHIAGAVNHSSCSAWTRARACRASCRRAWPMWLRFADARVERAWRAYHAASHTSTDLLWCALLLLVWLVAIGKRAYTHGPTPLPLAGGPALLLLAVRSPWLCALPSTVCLPFSASYARRFSSHGIGMSDRASPSTHSITPLSLLALRRCSRCSSTGNGISGSVCRCCARCASHRQGPRLPLTVLNQGRLRRMSAVLCWRKRLRAHAGAVCHAWGHTLHFRRARGDNAGIPIKDGTQHGFPSQTAARES